MDKETASAICIATAIRSYDARIGGGVHDMYVDRALSILDVRYAYTDRNAALTEARNIDTHDYNYDAAAMLKTYSDNIIQREYPSLVLSSVLHNLLTRA
jgi:hypothetical protein